MAANHSGCCGNPGQMVGGDQVCLLGCEGGEGAGGLDENYERGGRRMPRFLA